MIPDFQAIMLPLLQFLADGKERNNQEVVDAIAKHFNLTEEEIKKRHEKSKQLILRNTLSWTKMYLQRARLIDYSGNACVKITEAGIIFLMQNPKVLNNKLLKKQFPDFVKWLNNSTKQASEENSETSIKIASDDKLSQTPDELIEKAYLEIRQVLAEGLLSKIMEMNPYNFENLVLDLLVKMGYGTGEVTQKSADGGIDAIIKEDKLGLDKIYIQAKRWQKDNVVGRPEIQKFVGALAGQKSKKGVFITTSSFTKDASSYVEYLSNDHKIVLIDGLKLAEFMIDFNVGVSVYMNYEMKKIDNDYFDEY